MFLCLICDLCLYWILLFWCQIITYELVPICNLNLLAAGTSSPCGGNKNFSSKPVWEGMVEKGWNCFNGWNCFSNCPALPTLSSTAKAWAWSERFLWHGHIEIQILSLTLKRGLLLHLSFTWLSVNLDFRFLNPTLLWMSSLFPGPGR